METLEEFKTRLQKREGKGRKAFKISNSYGVYDIYKHIRKNGWYNIGRPLKEGEFYAIVRNVNRLLAEEIALGHTVTFPERMGKLELRKYEKGVSIVDGKLKNTYPIDWAETFKLWYEDEEEKNKKTLIRMEEPLVYHIKYCKNKANYENQCFYRFEVNRFLKKALSNNIKAGMTDTLWGS